MIVPWSMSSIELQGQNCTSTPLQVKNKLVFAGAIMVGVSEGELNNARWAIRRAEDEVQNCESSVNNFYSNLENKKWQKKQKEDEIAECSRAIEQINQNLAQVYTQRINIGRAQEKLRSSVNALGTLAGRASVAKTLTERVVCLPPLVNILGEIIQLLLQMQGDRKYELLQDPQVKATIQSLQEVHHKVSAIDYQQDLNELQFY